MIKVNIEYKFALVLILDETPDIDTPEGLTAIEKSHITLIGGKALKDHKDTLKPHKGLIEVDGIPDIKFGRTGQATRAMEINGTLESRKTFFVEVTNHDELRTFVSELCMKLGMINPEPNRFYHLSLANNHDGNPFKSVGDISTDDLVDAKSNLPMEDIDLLNE